MFFRINIHHNANTEDMNSKIRDKQNTIYNYFLENHGSVKDGILNPFNTNYRAMPKNEKRTQETIENIEKPNSTGWSRDNVHQ